MKTLKLTLTEAARALQDAIAAMPDEPAIEIPEGFTRHDGGKCPVPPDTMVEIFARDQYRTTSTAQKLAENAGGDWWTGQGADPKDVIVAYRIVKPAWRLPDPPPGHQWHRTDWREDMLPDGWRPLLDGEKREAHDQFLDGRSGKWTIPELTASADNDRKINCGSYHTRTRRPLPHRWQREKDAFAKGERVEVNMAGSGWVKLNLNDLWDSPYEFRIAAPELVPLEACDVPPGATFLFPDGDWFTPYECTGGYYRSFGFVKTLRQLFDEKATIHRPGTTDATGKPLWVPCSKEAR